MKCKEKGCKRTDIQSKKSGLCSIHYARWYRKNNKKKIRPVSRARYLRNKPKYKQYTKNYLKRNPDYYKTRNRNTSPEAKALNSIRWKTIGQFKHLKETGCCGECGSRKNLEFHHIEPFAYDNFLILCMPCHRALHGRLIIEMNDAKVERLRTRR